MIGVRDEVASWVNAYTAELFSYALSKVSHAAAAEDIVQNTFLSALESFDSFQNRSTPRTWLFSILKHKIADHYRLKYRQAQQFTIQDGADALFDENGRLKEPCSSIQWRMEEELLDDPAFLQSLHECIAALPKKMSIVVALKYLDGADSHSVCRELNISQANFWQIMHRAKLLLKTCIENKWFKTGKAG